MLRYFMETLGILLAFAGLFVSGWLLLGRLLTPVGSPEKPVLAVIPASGDGENLEFDVRGLLWMRGSGLARFTVVIADCGLNEAGRAAAQVLARREPDVLLCTPQELETLAYSTAKVQGSPSAPPREPR